MIPIGTIYSWVPGFISGIYSSAKLHTPLDTFISLWISNSVNHLSAGIFFVFRIFVYSGIQESETQDFAKVTLTNAQVLTLSTLHTQYGTALTPNG